jgi:predicted small secreted protein
LNLSAFQAAVVELKICGGFVNKFFSRLSLTLLLLLGTLLLAACPTRTSIGKIIRDPGRYTGREVAIAGRVSNSMGAFGSGVYQVEDGSGEIWVYSQRYGVPSNGAKVGVRGTVSQGFSFGGRSFAIVLHETERRH